MSVRIKGKSVWENSTSKIIKNKISANQNVIAKNSIKSNDEACLTGFKTSWQETLGVQSIMTQGL